MPFDPTDPEQRRIFRYFNGTRQVCADPEVLSRRLHKAVPYAELKALWETVFPQSATDANDSELDGLPPEIREKLNASLQVADEAAEPSPEAYLEAQERLCEIARDLFQVAPLDSDGHGLTELETLMLFAGFNAFVDSAKKKPSNLESTSPPSEESGPPASN